MENFHSKREEHVTGYRFYFNKLRIDAVDLIKYLDIEDPNLQAKSSERIEDCYQGLIFHTIFFEKFLELINKGYEFRSISALLGEIANHDSIELKKVVFQELEEEFDIDIEESNLDRLLNLTMISHMKDEHKKKAEEFLGRGLIEELAIERTCGKGI